VLAGGLASKWYLGRRRKVGGPKGVGALWHTRTRIFERWSLTSSGERPLQRKSQHEKGHGGGGAKEGKGKKVLLGRRTGRRGPWGPQVRETYGERRKKYIGLHKRKGESGNLTSTPKHAG